MRVAVIDIGSNTARLLVADLDGRGAMTPVCRERSYLRLGAEIEQAGGIRKKKLAEVTEVTGRFAEQIGALRVDRAEVIVTAPGRNNPSSGNLVSALAKATGIGVRILSGEQEGRLAFDGAVAACPAPPGGVIAVVDVGGGSTEIAVGTAARGADWVRSVEIGALRLSRSHLQGNPPNRSQVDEAARAIADAFDGLQPRPPQIAMAVGGSARAVGRIAGPVLDAAELERIAALLSRTRRSTVVRKYGIDAARAETTLAGALVLAEASRRLGVPLEVARGGLREGALLALAAHRQTAAA